MAQFDIFERPEGGYLLSLQSDGLERLNVRLVAPLLPEDEAPPAAEGLNPVFEIDGTRHVMLVQLMAAVAVDELTEPKGSLSGDRAEILAALDLLIGRF